MPNNIGRNLTSNIANGFKKWYRSFSNTNQYEAGTYLFVKVPWPGDREGTFSVFESSYHLLLSV